MKKWLAVVCLLYVGSLPLHAAEYGARVGGMALTPSGKASLAAGVLPATTLDLKQDMHFKRDVLPYGELFAEWGQHSFQLSWLNTSFVGLSNRTPFNFNGKTFSTGPYRFNVDLRVLEGGFSYYPVDYSWDTWRFRLGGELGVKSLRTQMQVKDTAISQSVATKAIIPSFGLRGDINFHSWVTLRTHYSFFRMAGNSLRDLELLVDLNRLVWNGESFKVDLFGGYRQIQVKLNAQNNGQLQTDTKLTGPVFGLRAAY